jgi:hypothetical protein
LYAKNIARISNANITKNIKRDMILSFIIIVI